VDPFKPDYHRDDQGNDHERATDHEDSLRSRRVMYAVLPVPQTDLPTSALFDTPELW
jgi:hypothetical protein